MRVRKFLAVQDPAKEANGVGVALAGCSQFETIVCVTVWPGRGRFTGAGYFYHISFAVNTLPRRDRNGDLNEPGDVHSVSASSRSSSKAAMRNQIKRRA